MHAPQTRRWPDGATAQVRRVWFNAREWTVVRFHDSDGGLVAVRPDPGRVHPAVTGRHVGNAPGFGWSE